MDTLHTAFEQQLDTFLLLAGRKALANPTPDAFAQWFAEVVPSVLPTLLAKIDSDPP